MGSYSMKISLISYEFWLLHKDKIVPMYEGTGNFEAINRAGVMILGDIDVTQLQEANSYILPMKSAGETNAAWEERVSVNANSAIQRVCANGSSDAIYVDEEPYIHLFDKFSNWPKQELTF